MRREIETDTKIMNLRSSDPEKDDVRKQRKTAEG